MPQVYTSVVLRMGNRKFNVDVYETFGGILENDFLLTDDLVCSLAKR